MKKSFATNKAILLVLLAAMCCAVLVVSLALPAPKADAYNGNVPSTTYDIYDSANKKFKTTEFANLLKALGSPDGTYAKLPSATSAGTSVASKEIIVELGGMKWIAMYYSSAVTTHGTDSKGVPKSGDKVLTLWLAEADSNTYQWNQNNDSGGNTGNYPSNVYGTSYIRAEVLNNGGNYWKNNGSNGSNSANEGITGSASVSSSNFFANFTTDAIGLISNNAIVAPRYIDWQWTQDSANVKNSSGSAYSTYGFNNDSLSKGSTFDGYDWSTKTGYTNWQDDYLWLPSVSEVGNTTYNVGTLWSPTNNQLASSGAIWLRSGRNNNSTNAYSLNASGGYDNRDVVTTYRVRPALHLNLTSAAQASGCTTHSWGATWTWNPSTPSKTDGVTPTATATVTCSACGEKHENVSATVTRTAYSASSCTTAGSETWQAEITEYGVSTSQTYSLPTLSHNYNTLSDYTWSTGALTETSMPTVSATIKCATCTTTVNATTSVTERTESKLDPTCLGTGSRTFYGTATYSGTSLTIPDKTYTIAAKGHSFDKTHATTTAATCTDDGYTGYWYCNNCYYYFDVNAATSANTSYDYNHYKLTATGHTWSIDTAKGTSGWSWTGYTSAVLNFKCDNSCGTPHTITASIRSEVTQNADCTTQGRKTHTATVSSFSGLTTSDKFTVSTTQTNVQYETVAANGHAFTVQTLAATCTTDGYKRQYCSACSKYFTSDATTSDTNGSTSESGVGVVSAAGHTFQLVNATNGTDCQTKGFVSHYKCTSDSHDNAKDGDMYFASDSDTNAKGVAESTFQTGAVGNHSFSDTFAKSADCENNAWLAYRNCSICNLYYSEGAELGSGTAMGKRDASSFEQQSTALGHDWTVDVTSSWNWQEDYSQATVTITCGRSCSYSNGTQTLTVSSSSSVHTAATCTADQTLDYKVSITYPSNGGKTHTDQKLDILDAGSALGHNLRVTAWHWHNGSSEMTAGSTISKDQLNSVTVTVDVACERSDYTAKGVDANISQISDKYTAPKCEAVGSVTFTTSISGYFCDGGCVKGEHTELANYTSGETTFVVAETGHLGIRQVNKQEPTCTVNGYEAYFNCSDCSKNFRDESALQELASLSEIAIPAKGHTLQADKWNWNQENGATIKALQDITVTVDISCAEGDFSVKGVQAKRNAAVEDATNCEQERTVSCKPSVSYSNGKEIVTLIAESGDWRTFKLEAGQHAYDATFTWQSASEWDGVKPTVTLVLVCSVCSDEVTPELTVVDEERVAAKCEQAGHVTFKASAEVSGEQYSEVSGEYTLAALEHSFGSWQTDYNQHWRDCDNGCGVKDSEGAHNWTEEWGWGDSEDDLANLALAIHCDVCDKSDSFDNSQLNPQQKGERVEPTCNEGSVTYTASVEYGDNPFTDEHTYILPATDVHSWELVSWNWPASYTSATPEVTVLIKCSKCQKDATLDAEVTEVEDSRTTPDCEHTGSVSFTAKATTDSEQDFTSEEQQYTIPALGHKLNKTDKVEPTYNEKGRKAYWTCSVCGKHFSDQHGTKLVNDLADLDIDMLTRVVSDYDIGWATVSLTAQLLILIIAFRIASRKKKKAK